MNYVLFAALVLASSDPQIANVTPPQALEGIADQMQTGTLIVGRGDCLAVKFYSASSYTHVAAVVMHEGRALVYDATGGAGVRKQSLGEYLAAQNGHTLHIFQPRKPFTQKAGTRFERHLEAQLGRPYAIHHHLTGKRALGLHCSEYITDALIAAGQLQAREPPRVSPATLVEGILKAEIYEEAARLRVICDPPERPDSGSWCALLWFGTKQCTLGCYLKLRGWFCCK